MSAIDWEDLKEEVCTLLEDGMEKGETELDTVTRLIWQERQRHADLMAALQKYTALEHGTEIVKKTAVLLKFRKPVVRKPGLLEQREKDSTSSAPHPGTA